MDDQDSLYKREEDRKWRERTEERLVSLTQGETVQNDRLDECDEEIRGIKEVLDGKPNDRDDNGIAGDIDMLKQQMRAINGVLWPSDPLSVNAKVGLVSDVRRLVNNEDRQERRADRWWKGLTPIVIALVSTVGLLLTNLDRIVGVWHQIYPPATSSTKSLKSGSKRSGSRRPKRKAPAQRIEEPTEDESSSEGVSEVQ